MAALNFNKVMLCGRLTADPELKQTQSGIAVLSFTIGVNRRYVSKTQTEAGAQQPAQQTADFPNLVAWRQTAEFIARYFRRGSPIFIVGSIQTRSWNDQQGNKRYTTEVVVDEAYFVDSKSDNPAFGQQAPYQQAPYQQNQQSQSYQAAPAPDNFAPAPPAFSSQPEAAGQFQEVASDDDLPF